jgi:hypothetical protein
MRRVLLVGLVATLVVVAVAGVALATTHGSKAVGSGPAAAGSGVESESATTPVLAGDVPPSQPNASAAATPPPTSGSKPKTDASISSEGGANDCWDDCGDPGGSDCSSAAGTGHGSTGVVDDDGDGDGGDCGQGD